MMELPELFTPAELADIIAPDINLNGDRSQCQQSGGTTIFTMCDPMYPYPPRFLIIINNKRISIAEHDHNDCNLQTELIRITKDDCCPDGFHVSNCTKSKTHTILILIDKIKKAIDEKVIKNRIETNIRNEITITDDDIINIIATSACIRNFTTFEIPCGNYKEIFIDDKEFPMAHIRYGFSKLDNIIQIIKKETPTYIKPGGSVENTEILVRLDTSNGAVERLITTPMSISIAYKLEGLIENNNNNKENIREEKNMSEIRKDEYENNGVTYGISKIGEAVERWLTKRDMKPCKKSKDPSIYTWEFYDGRLILSLQKLAHGFIISQTNGNYSGMRSTLVKITPPFRVDIIANSSLEDLVYEIKNIPNIQETKRSKRKKVDDLIPKGPAPSILVKNITFNTVRGTTTVVFDDNTKTMTTTTSGEEFNPEIGLAMCIAKKLYGSRSNFKRVVQLAMTKSEKGNKKRALKEKKKAEKAEAIKENT